MMRMTNYQLRQSCCALLTYANLRHAARVAKESRVSCTATAIHSRRSASTEARLTPADVSDQLREAEFTLDVDKSFGAVRSFDTNTLPSNEPSEDGHVEGVIRNVHPTLSDPAFVAKATLFGVIDGHGGASCGQVVTRRILDYVAAALLSSDDLVAHRDAMVDRLTTTPSNDASGRPSTSTTIDGSLIDYINFKFKLTHDLQHLYQHSYTRYVDALYDRLTAIGHNRYESISVGQRMVHAFMALDADMSIEALPLGTPDHVENRRGASATTVPRLDHEVYGKTRNVAMSGAVANVAHITHDGHLHIASTGDCTAVLGSLSENETWVARKLTAEHNADNADEVARIASEHPNENIKDIIKCERLLGILAPVRAFGDFRFKWPKSTIVSTLAAELGQYAVASHYLTPPYLTVEPAITSLKLHHRDKFLVVASDGLWDMLAPMQVVRLVGEHMSGKQTLTPFEVERDRSVTMGQIAERLKRRQAFMRLKPADSNAATHLIRAALGSTAYGLDHARLSQMLSMPAETRRMFRDDITIQVIFFDSEYIAQA